MTIEKIVAEVQERLGKTQVSATTIEALASLIPLAEGTEPDEAYFEKIGKACGTVQGNLNAEAAAAVNAYKERHPTPPTPPTPPEAAAPPELKAALDRIKALEDGMSENLRREAIGRVRSNVMDRSSELRVTSANLWKDTVSALDIKEGSSEEDVLKSAKETYEAKLKEYFGEGAVPYGKGDGGGDGGDGHVLDSFFERKKAEGRL